MKTLCVSEGLHAARSVEIEPSEIARKRGASCLVKALCGKTILFVDFDADVQDASAYALLSAGACVITTDCVDRAVTAFLQHRPDAVLTDIGFAGAEGDAVARAIRECDAHRGTRTPIVALTASVGPTDARQQGLTRFDRWLVKPVQPDLLVEAIRQLVGLEASLP